MANPLRNETDVKLGSKSYTLRATFGAVSEIEQYFQKSIAEITLDELARAKVGVTGLKAILQAGLKGAGDKISEAELEAAIIEAGVVAVTDQLVTFLSQVFNGAPVSKNE